MKKCTVRALLLFVAWSTMVGTAAALEEGSLLHQNTFGLYYLEDPFDLTVNPAFLSRIERWRLFTNLSNYEDANSYLIGTSGRLGPGSVGLFYERDKERWVDQNSRSSDQTSDVSGWYGKNDIEVTAESSADRFEEESTRNAFVVSYGMDFGGFTLGAAYRPSFSSGKTTLRGDLEGSPDFGTDPLYWTRPSFSGDLQPGRNYARSWRRARYDGKSGALVTEDAGSEAFTGSADADEDTHAVDLGSELRVFKSVRTWVRVGARSVKRTVSGSGSYASTNSYTQRDDGSGNGYMVTESRTSTWEGEPVGSPEDHAFDGTEWSLDVVPRYAVSTAVTLELGLGWEGRQGDVSGTWTQDIGVTRTQTGRGTDTWLGSQHVANTFSGDSDRTGYSLTPRVYLTYGTVEFALGVGVSHLSDDVSGTQRGAGTMSWSYDDGSGLGSDFSYAGTTTTRSDRSLEYTATVLSFPVAARFRVTDKLELRAGAEFVQTDSRTKRSESTRADEEFAITDGRGNVLRQGPATRGIAEADVEERTVSATHYRLGAGYRVTDNLQFDLLFSRSAGDGAVDTTAVHASAVFAF
ncbi:MAG TPA: hypothetical protein VI078_15490 [bacterium]